MIVITKLIMLGIVIVCAVTLAFILLDFVADKVKSKSSKKISRVHLYVARDKGGLLYLYLGKPKRSCSVFVGIRITSARLIEDEYNLKRFGLNPDDSKYLTWEDEPVEVFVNMED